MFRRSSDVFLDMAAAKRAKHGHESEAQQFLRETVAFACDKLAIYHPPPLAVAEYCNQLVRLKYDHVRQDTITSDERKLFDLVISRMRSTPTSRWDAGIRQPLYQQQICVRDLLVEEQTLCYRNVTDILPAELMSEIFTFAFRDDRVRIDFVSGTHAFDTPAWPDSSACQVVSSVCRRWRQIALDTPVIWQSIEIADKHHLERAKLWLSRARGCPVDIYARLDRKLIDQTLNVIGPYRGQWRTLIVDVHKDYHAMLQFFDSLSLNAPISSLTNLEVLYHRDPAMHEGRVTIPVHLFPNLTSLDICHTLIELDPMPFANLTRLEIGYGKSSVELTAEELVSLLSASTTLQHLALRCAGPMLFDPWSDLIIDVPKPTSLQFPSLHTFIVSDASFEALTFLMQLIMAPNLSYLSLSNLQDGVYDPILSLIPTIYPRITKLHIASVRFTMDPLPQGEANSTTEPPLRLEFARLLMALPFLSHLHLESRHFPWVSIFYGAFLAKSLAPMALHHLETLQVSGAPTEGVLQFAAYRKEVDASLQVILDEADYPEGSLQRGQVIKAWMSGLMAEVVFYESEMSADIEWSGGVYQAEPYSDEDDEEEEEEQEE